MSDSDAPPPPVEQSELIERSEDAIAAIADLFAQAERQVAILSDEFDRALYGDERLVDALQRFALSHERARVRVLVNRPEAAMRRAHRFVELARRISSRVDFRELPDELRELRQEWVIVDERGLWLRESPSHFESRCYRHAPLEARARLKRYNEIWEQSTVAREFSRLGV